MNERNEWWHEFDDGETSDTTPGSVPGPIPDHWRGADDPKATVTSPFPTPPPPSSHVEAGVPPPPVSGGEPGVATPSPPPGPVQPQADQRRGPWAAYRVGVITVGIVLAVVAGVLAFGGGSDIASVRVDPSSLVVPAGYTPDPTSADAIDLGDEFNGPDAWRNGDSLLIVYSRSIDPDDVAARSMDELAPGAFADQLLDDLPGFTTVSDEAVGVDAGGRLITLEDGGSRFDALVFATSQEPGAALVFLAVTDGAEVDLPGIVRSVRLVGA